MYRKSDLSNKIAFVFHKKITVREINRHLNALIKELLERHGQVSSPDFERELQATAGIGWKQVKNYQNHPQPDKAVNENSKIKKFVLERRRRHLWLKITNRRFLFLFVAGASLTLVTATAGVFWNARRSKEVVAQELPFPSRPSPIKNAPRSGAGRISIVVKKFGLTLRLGPMTKSLAGFKELKCDATGGRKTCSYTGPMLPDGPSFQLILGMHENAISMVNLVSANPSIFSEWDAQVRSQLASHGFKHDQQQDVWSLDGETVMLQGNRIVVMRP